MSTKKTRHYVVWKGVRPGIYKSWREASEQVTGYSGAQHKSFGCIEDAEAAFCSQQHAVCSELGSQSSVTLAATGDVAVPELFGLAVDASCRGNPGPMEYRGVWLLTGQQYFHNGPYEDGTNNIGEFLAIVHAAALVKYAERPDVTIYSDSLTALGWVRARTCGTQLKQTARNAPVFELIDRALVWLKNNHVDNPLQKWDTEHWREIPADFGRK